MKKTVKISLGGRVFNIEEDAYALLDEYLNAISKHLGDSPEAKEIINDIEERAAELLLEMLEKTEIITLLMVESVSQTIGKPEDISGAADQAEANAGDTQYDISGSGKKRFYRDPEDSVIAGVCSGLGAYFGVNPVVFRIFFVLLAFAKGLGILLYVILWALFPKAVTPRQRLEMRGEPVNLENLEDVIKQEYESVRSNLKRNNIDSVIERIGLFIKKVLFGIGTAITIIAKVFVGILGVVFIGVGLFTLTVIVGAFFLKDMALGLVFPDLYGASIADFVTSTIDCAPAIWAIVPIFIITVIPVLLIVYLGIKILFRFKARSSIPISILALVWVLSVVMLAFLIFFQARSFTIREAVTQEIAFTTTEPVGTLFVTSEGIDDLHQAKSREILSVDPYTIATSDGTVRILGRPNVQFTLSATDTFYVKFDRVSRGATGLLARNNAKNIIMPIDLDNSTLKINPFFILPEGDRWRVQEVIVRVGVPEGKRVAIHRSLEGIIDSKQPNTNAWPNELAGATWRMTNGKLIRD